MLLAWHNYSGGKTILEEIYKSPEHGRDPSFDNAVATGGLVQKPVSKVET
jgi:TRAP-type mannitol/chloroaromatic compound transport system substrate-binding protein